MNGVTSAFIWWSDYLDQLDPALKAPCQECDGIGVKSQHAPVLCIDCYFAWRGKNNH